MAQKGDVIGLVALAVRRDEQRDYDGQVRDAAVAVRLDALAALAEFPEGDLAPAIEAGIGDPFPEVRAATVRLARGVGASSFSEGLIRALATWDPTSCAEARTEARETLAKWSIEGSAKQFALALTAPDGVKFERERDQSILDHLASRDPRGHETAAIEAATALVQRVDGGSKSYPERVRAAEIASWMPGASAGAVRSALADREPSVEVIGLAGALRENGLLDVLIPLSEHAEPGFRAQAARAIGIIQDTRGVAALLRLTQDETFAVREASKEALDRFGVSGVVFGLAAAGDQATIQSGESEADQRALASAGESDSANA